MAEDARFVPFTTPAERAASARAVADHLRAGGCIVYPTETVYGFGCALRPAALQALAGLKARETGRQPFLLLVPEAGNVDGVRWTPAADRMATAFWPGPLTLALDAEPGRFPPEVVSSEGTVAVRRSPHPAVRAILDAFGAPITSTSANRPGEPPARDAATAADAAAGLDPAVALLILDGGTLSPSPPSTLIRAGERGVRILREGAIGRDAVRRALGEIDVE